MILSIVDGICEKLSGIFGEDCKIYTEPVKQGLKTPCFFVSLVNPASRRELGERFYRENLFCVQYLPASTNESAAECCRVQDELYLALEYITVNGRIQRGTKMYGELRNGVLNFFVNFNVHAVKVKDKTLMEKLELPSITTKG